MNISSRLKEKLQTLPDRPGVYFMRDRQGRIIYVGKAVSLRQRVRSYFRAALRQRGDPKLRSLVHSIADFDVIVTRTEAEATLTEGRLIKEYRPRYNVAFRDDKRFLLIRVDLRDPWPRFDAVRLRKNDGAEYFGPYASTRAARAALEFLDKRLGLRRCRPIHPDAEDHRHCINDIVRYCSAPCIGRITREEYLSRAQSACAFLRGERPDLLEDLAEAMQAAAREMDFEKAAALRDTLLLLRRAIAERVRGTKDLTVRAEEAERGIRELQMALGLRAVPRFIEAYDISNISGTHAVGSLVCAVNGLPDKRRYRMFRIRTAAGRDDPAMMEEVLRRRFERALREESGLPDLVLVDGGLTQLRAARAALDRLGLTALPAAGLAKRFEQLYWRAPGHTRHEVIRLSFDSPALKVLQRIRDEAHRFAIKYHRRLRFRVLRESALDEIAGIGPLRKTELLQRFGSVERLSKATVEEIASVSGIGLRMAERIRSALTTEKSADAVAGHSASRAPA